MNTQEILDLFRGLADDVGTPALWSNTVLLGFLNEAQLEAVRRTRMLEDQDTDEICEIAVVSGTAVYDVDPRVIFIRRVAIDDVETPLVKLDPRDLDKARPTWRTDDEVLYPAFWLPWGNQQIRIEKPLLNSTMRLWVVREPLEDCRLAEPDAEPDPITAVSPEIPARYHHKLVDWMLYRALSMRDKEEKYDPKSAADHLALFEQEFGPRSSAIDETWIQRKHGYDEYEGVY
jgi:hypothetical protein